ncbi:MAG: dedA protein [Pseudomonadota bacterium]|jgi:membrane protein DedA with SNARE-associated domain
MDFREFRIAPLTFLLGQGLVPAGWNMDHEIFQLLSQYAYQPLMVYSLVFALLFASSFGLPIPEEVTILSVGFLAYAGNHPDRFPPPTGMDGEPINVHTAAWLCFLAVFISDLMVFILGKKFGGKLLRRAWFKKIMPGRVLPRARMFARKYGSLAAGIFRFTPALRFPGHFSCGMFGVPVWKFFAVDGLAALLSVPTQVYLIYFYGDSILAVIEKFKVSLLVLGTIGLVGWLTWRKVQGTSRFNSGYLRNKRQISCLDGKSGFPVPSDQV